MLSTQELGHEFGGQILFRNASLQLEAGERYGIVGANGSGKSTLLRILAGEEDAAHGDVMTARGARIGVLEQDHFQFDAVPILDVVMMGHDELWAAMVEKEAVLARAHEHFDEDRYVELEDIVTKFDGYGMEARAGEILEGLGIPVAKHRLPLSALSGGFKLRALLARTLASEPDILLLDEPTNHLDILAIGWLEGFLMKFAGCAVVVSHDLDFLDRICTGILDVDYERVTAYRGNHSAFERQKLEARERMEKEITSREKEIEEQKAFVARFKAKASKARQANSRQKRIEKLVIEPLPKTSRRRPSFRFTGRRQSGKSVLDVKGISKAYGELQVLRDVSFNVRRGERVAVIGPNGIGKSTLLEILTGNLVADLGEAEWGYEVDVGYFPQDHKAAIGDPDQTVKGAMWHHCPTEGMGPILGRLAAVLFGRDDVDKQLEHLSGGEAARLRFAQLGAMQSTVMVLDEPTNHLDIESIGALAEALRKYDGTLVFVSHDRWFVNRVATRILEIRPDGITDFKGRYADYARQGNDDHLDRDEVARKAKVAKRQRRQGDPKGA